MLGAILVEYNFHEHVSSDIGIGQLFLPAEQTRTQENIDSISSWTTNKLKQLNKDKTNYIVFSQARTEFATRFTLEGQVLERKKYTKLIGVWLQEGGEWQKNVDKT